MTPSYYDIDDTQPSGEAVPSAEEQRLALRRALASRPGDPQLREPVERLFSPHQVRQAARRGVFITYSRAEELFALQLAEDLRSSALNVWLDISDISDDADWRGAVTEALERCGVMVMIISQEALQDADVRAEYRYFMQAGKIIVPVLHEPCDIRRLQILIPPVDCSHDYENGLYHLRQLLKSTSDVFA